MQPGTKIKLFASPLPNADGACTEITVRLYVEDKCIPYFNFSASDDQVGVILHKGKGAPGKVSRIEIQSS